MSMRLTGVELYSADLERSKAFYEEVLGLSLSENVVAHHVKFDTEGTFLCMEVPGSEDYPSADKAVLFFEVSDLAEVIARIGNKRFTKISVDGRPRWAVLSDPDGHNILLLQRTQT